MEAVQQITVAMPNIPSSLAKLGDRLRAADVNILGMTCTEGRPNTSIHLVVDDPETAKIVLREIGTVSTRPILSLTIKNKPGAIASVARDCAAAGINIRNFYTTLGGREGIAYIDCEDADKALELLKKWKRDNAH